VLVVCGSWGQGRIERVVRELRGLDRGLHVHAVCGTNTRMRARLSRELDGAGGVSVHGHEPSLAPLFSACGSVITKPGIATLVEARAAGRKIFLLRGMPVAEDNNARWAVRHFAAEWFRPETFARWLGGA
jgi:UDP-N-acetylglucosamine:LPS N-acetylglucosamine transferase